MKIVKIEKTNDFIEMYDVLNTKNKRFIANNLVLHNSASDMTKLSLRSTNNDIELINLKGRVIIPVHDELIMRSPLRYARETKDLFRYDMEHAADGVIDLGIKCDVSVTYNWNGEELDLDKELEGIPHEKVVYGNYRPYK